MTESIGCIDYGNNNFWEVHKHDSGAITFESHEDGEILSAPDFFAQLDSDHVNDVQQQLTDLFEP